MLVLSHSCRTPPRDDLHTPLVFTLRWKSTMENYSYGNLNYLWVLGIYIYGFFSIPPKCAGAGVQPLGAHAAPGGVTPVK